MYSACFEISIAIFRVKHRRLEFGNLNESSRLSKFLTNRDFFLKLSQTSSCSVSLSTEYVSRRFTTEIYISKVNHTENLTSTYSLEYYLQVKFANRTRAVAAIVLARRCFLDAGCHIDKHDPQARNSCPSFTRHNYRNHSAVSNAKTYQSFGQKRTQTLPTDALMAALVSLL